MLSAESHVCAAEPESCFPRLPHTMFAYGFSYNKRRLLKQFAAQSTLRFVRDGAAVNPGSTLLLWGSNPPPRGLTGPVRVIRVEDGFLRSVGLGAELIRPLSWVFDFEGIYYDANRPSLLENWLNTLEFDQALLLRAARLRTRIVASGLTKYNVCGKAWTRPITTRQVILVVGQVEGDASLAHGAGEIHRNMELLRAVRHQYPGKYLLYRPHPDLVAGLRRGGRDCRAAEDLCDEVVTNAAMPALLAQVDQVHVMTSLAGFEALLREKSVVCHGRPFYAGWGLTDDRVPIPRRTRTRSLDELVAAALLIYPTYVSSRSGRRTTAEEALQDLIEWRARAEHSGFSVSRAARRCLFMLYSRLTARGRG